MEADVTPLAIEWSTDAGEGRRVARTQLVFVCATAGGCASCAVFAAFAGNGLSAMLFAGAAVATLPLLMLRRVGKWRVDQEGLEYTPVGKDTSRLLWGEVESVYWAFPYPKFRATHKTVTLMAIYLDQADWQQLRAFIVDRLSDSFDLSMSSKPRPPRLSVGLVARLVVIAVIVTGISMGCTLFHLFVLTRLGVMENLAVVWLYLPTFAWAALQTYKHRQSHSLWRERLKQPP